MKHIFSEIIILYNPVSTGGSKANAETLKETLVAQLADTKVLLRKTEYAGHAEEIGAEYATKKGVLLVSSSGDGGYNELINGVLAVKNNTVSVCVLPSGNANDHFNATQNDNLVDNIVAGKTTKIDVLRIDGIHDGTAWSRHAHSYIGAGVTAYVGKKLTEADLNPINEKWLVLKYLVKFSHVSLKVNSWGHKKFYRYSSFVAANIDRMSKIIKLDRDSSVTDGKFEIYAIRSRSLGGLVRRLISASIVGKKVTDKVESIRFISRYPLEIQCDGEVFIIDKGRSIAITVELAVLKTVD